MNENIQLTNSLGKTKIFKNETDKNLLILSIFGLGSIKLFFDNRITDGIINMLLIYTIFGSIIHGIILALKPNKYLVFLLKQEYVPKTEEDQKKIEQILGRTVAYN